MGTFAYHADNPRISAITGHKVVAGGTRGYQPFCHIFSVKDQKDGHWQNMNTYNMWEVPEGMKVDSELGKIPVEMDLLIHFHCKMFPKVVDYGLTKTKDGELAWIVLEKSKDDGFKSLNIYAHFERRRRSLFAKELFNPLITLIPELERIEDYLHGGGIYNVGTRFRFKESNGIITKLRIDSVPLVSSPNQGLFDAVEHIWLQDDIWCLAPETRTAHYDHRADVFALARSLSCYEHGNAWMTSSDLRSIPFEEEFRKSCEMQIEMGLDGVDKHVMEKALAFNPDDRYLTLTEFFEALVYE
nr:hypothetical protein [uncultured Prevotella sp.]